MPVFQPWYETASTDRAHTEILLLGRCVVEIERISHELNPDAGVTDEMYISATVSHCHTLGCPRRVLHAREHKWTPSLTTTHPNTSRAAYWMASLRSSGCPRETESSGVVVATRASVHCTVRATHTRNLFTFKSMRKHRTSNVMWWLCSN